jgi:hypothetical protein
MAGKTDQLISANGTTTLLKKKRVSKKLSIVSTQENSQEILAASLGLTGNVFKKIDNETAAMNPFKSKPPEFTEVSNHFVFGNQVAEGTNKTSNNKLDQSLRISYSEMVKTLESYQQPNSEAIAALNVSFENEFFAEWLSLTRYFLIFIENISGNCLSYTFKF